MPLTAAQKTALTNDINANTATAPGTSGQIKDLTHNADNADAVAKWYNLFPGTDFFGNYKNVPINDIKGAITFKNYTPADVVPTADVLTATIHMARTAFAQAFAMNINNLFVAGATFDATNPSLVAALKDATNTDMPTGVAGANQKGGWGGASGVQTKLCRKGTNAEKLFATTGAGADGSSATQAATFTFEGALTVNDIRDLWGT